MWGSLVVMFTYMQSAEVLGVLSKLVLIRSEMFAFRVFVNLVYRARPIPLAHWKFWGRPSGKAREGKLLCVVGHWRSVMNDNHWIKLSRGHFKQMVKGLVDIITQCHGIREISKLIQPSVTCYMQRSYRGSTNSRREVSLAREAKPAKLHGLVTPSLWPGESEWLTFMNSIHQQPLFI